MDSMSEMKLQEVFFSVPGIPENFFPHREVLGITSDARQVQPGFVFVAIQGVKADGHQYIPDALKAGAIALVVSDMSKVPSQTDASVVQVPKPREVLDLLASRFYADPGQELFCVGVTGTNGKTSITYMIESILSSARVPTGVVGTIDHHLGNQVWPSTMTTPEPVALQKRLREFRDAGARAVAMEISSHALDQFRADSVPFNAVVFTNLTRDHLDYHQTMDAYFEAKQRLFTDLLWKTTKVPCYAIINTDDKYGRRLRVADPAVLWTYGVHDSDLQFKITKMDFAVTEFDLKTPRGNTQVKLPMSGLHNVLNATAALGVGLAAGIELEKCVQALNNFTGVPGRLQSVPNDKNISVFVDYAHSPDALENVLESLQKVRSNLKSSAKIWTLFGCGGDRDKGKRPLMAEVAARLSDQVMVTSDNPRTEDPAQIIKEIMIGFDSSENSRVQSEVDRRQAIQKVLSQAQEGDVVVIAGKGHEDYQIIGTEKFPFSDVNIAQEILEKR